MGRDPRDRYTPAEEIANSLTHGLGTLLAAAGLVALVTGALRRGGAAEVASALVFGLSLLALYASSTLYHAVRDRAAKQVLRRLDHAAIFLLIAGSYTPFTLVTLRGAWGWTLFGVVWSLALVGLFCESALRRRWVGYSLALYLLMGWVAVAATRPLLALLPAPGFALVVAGGLAYTLGTVFYLVRRIPFHHAWWHLAVLAGSGLHYAAVALYVIPLR
jgi:hemolysin III